MSGTRTTRTAALVLAGTLMLTAVHTPAMASIMRHTHLVKSEPAANDTLSAAPRAIKLWFSEKVELGVTTVKLADAMGAAVALAKVARPDTVKDAPVVAVITKPLAPGAYLATWSTASDDGHPAKGTIAFVVTAAKAAR